MAAALAAHPKASPIARLNLLGREYVAFAREQPAHFRVMFGESGTTARDPRLRSPSLERSPYEQLEDAIRAWAESRRGTIDLTRTALLLWAGAHGIARLVVDGALPLDEDEIEALLVKMLHAVLANATSRRKRALTHK
jgi:hypothetical protein